VRHARHLCHRPPPLAGGVRMQSAPQGAPPPPTGARAPTRMRLRWRRRRRRSEPQGRRVSRSGAWRRSRCPRPSPHCPVRLSATWPIGRGASADLSNATSSLQCSAGILVGGKARDLHMCPGAHTRGGVEGAWGTGRGCRRIGRSCLTLVCPCPSQRLSLRPEHIPRVALDRRTPSASVRRIDRASDQALSVLKHEPAAQGLLVLTEARCAAPVSKWRRAEAKGVEFDPHGVGLTVDQRDDILDSAGSEGHGAVYTQGGQKNTAGQQPGLKEARSPERARESHDSPRPHSFQGSPPKRSRHRAGHETGAVTTQSRTRVRSGHNTDTSGHGNRRVQSAANSVHAAATTAERRAQRAAGGVPPTHAAAATAWAAESRAQRALNAGSEPTQTSLCSGLGCQSGRCAWVPGLPEGQPEGLAELTCVLGRD